MCVCVGGGGILNVKGIIMLSDLTIAKLQSRNDDDCWYDVYAVVLAYYYDTIVMVLLRWDVVMEVKERSQTVTD